MFPFTDIFRDCLHPSSKTELTQAKQSAGHQNQTRRSWRGEGIVAKEIDKSGPERGSRLDLIPLPSLIMLPQGAQTSSHLLLGQFQQEPPGQEVLPKGFGLQNEALMNEIPESQGSPGGLEREVAKWQNRVIPFSNDSHGAHTPLSAASQRAAARIAIQRPLALPTAQGTGSSPFSRSKLRRMNGHRHAPIIKDENVLLTLGPPASGIEDYRRSAVISSFTLSITACISP